MNVDDLNVLLPAPPARPALSALWGFVTGVDPLRVRLDGDAAALPVTPVALVAGLQVGDRVWCMLSGRQLIVLGRAGAAAPVVPSGWVTAGFTIGAGWSASVAQYRLSGALVEVRLMLSPSTTKTFGSDGNIADETAATLPAAIWPATTFGVAGEHGYGPSSWRLETDGDVVLVGGVPTGTITSSHNVKLQCVYHLG